MKKKTNINKVTGIISIIAGIVIVLFAIAWIAMPFYESSIIDNPDFNNIIGTIRWRFVFVFILLVLPVSAAGVALGIISLVTRKSTQGRRIYGILGIILSISWVLSFPINMKLTAYLFW